jgi:hypothetical protein
MGLTREQIVAQQQAEVKGVAVIPATSSDDEKALLILKNEPFGYSDTAAAAVLKKRGAASILTGRGQFLTLLDEWANAVPFQLVNRLEKLVELHLPKG